MHPVREPPLERISMLSIRLALQQMCEQFLLYCYNPIMKLTKVLYSVCMSFYHTLIILQDNLVRDRAMEHDDTYYLWVMRYLQNVLILTDCDKNDFIGFLWSLIGIISSAWMLLERRLLFQHFTIFCHL